jgi:hypothetical protein
VLVALFQTLSHGCGARDRTPPHSPVLKTYSCAPKVYGAYPRCCASCRHWTNSLSSGPARQRSPAARAMLVVRSTRMRRHVFCNIYTPLCRLPAVVSPPAQRKTHAPWIGLPRSHGCQLDLQIAAFRRPADPLMHPPGATNTDANVFTQSLLVRRPVAVTSIFTRGQELCIHRHGSSLCSRYIFRSLVECLDLRGIST